MLTNFCETHILLLSFVEYPQDRMPDLSNPADRGKYEKEVGDLGQILRNPSRPKTV